MSKPTRRPIRREVTLRTAAITADDAVLLQDLDAVARLKRTTRSAIVADIVRQTLGPRFAKHISA